MKRIILVGILFSCLAFASRKISNNLDSQEISDLKINWSAPIGNVSFRTNIDFLDGNLIIGSNGGNYMDYFIDKGNGVYILDPKTGKTQLNFANESFGDMDVNGVLVYKDRIYFGNDNDEIICADQKGKIIFRQDASGDIEHRPILIQSGTKTQLVFAMETGEVRSIDPESGTINWTYYHPNFQGQKVGDNRTMFKLKMHFYSGDKFFLEPVLRDLNNDKVQDLIYIAEEIDVFAIDGKTGKLITSILNEYPDQYYGTFHCTLSHSAPAIIESGNQMLIALPFACNFEGDLEGKKAINQLRIFNLNGKEVKRIDLGNDIRTSGCVQRDNRLFFGRKWIDFSGGLDNYTIHAYDLSIKNYSIPRIAQKSLTIAGDECLIFSFEYGFMKENTYDKSTIGIYNLRKKAFENLHHVNVTSEFIPVIGDMNKDNKVDILLGCHDGVLYNFDLNIAASAINN